MPPSAGQIPAASPEQIVILSPEYLANTHYSTLGKVSVKDVSESGFSKEEAKEGLKYEAFRQYGKQAKGITNVTYEGETTFFGSERYYAASGDVITWEEGSTATTASDASTRSQLQEKPYSAGAEAWGATAPALDVQPLETAGAAPPYQQQPVQQPYPPAQGGIASPANILILADEDLVGYDFWILGKISVQSKSKDGFDKDRANRALKAEAFRKYGVNARGIVNVTYEKKRGLLNMRSSTYKGASGNVVTWQGTKAAAPQRQQVMEPPVSTSQAPPATGRPAPEYVPKAPIPSQQATYTPTNILVLSSDDLVTMNFRSLGRIRVTDELENSFDKKTAIKALKVEAFKKYGVQAKGITNIDFRRKTGILNYGKFSEVYADVLTWDSDQAPLQVSASEVAPLPPSPEAPETPTARLPVVAPDTAFAGEAAAAAPLPDYTTEVVDYEDIMILDADELLTPTYKTLGTVTVEAPSRHGFREFEANDALKREALNKFGGRVRALIDVEYVRASTFHSTDDKVTSATGEAITW